MNQSFKVITQDKNIEPYLRELDSIVALTRRIGVLYNEAIIKLQIQAITLTKAVILNHLNELQNKINRH